MTSPTFIEPTAEQIKKWGDTRAALVWFCPAFSHIFYTMMSKDGSEHLALFSRDVPYAATDGKHIIINPDTFFEWTLQERIFVVAHEICHGIFDHMGLMNRLRTSGKVSYPDGKVLDYDHSTMNVAMDYVINDMLKESNIGTMPSVGCHDKMKGTHMDSVVDVYRRIFEEQQGKGPGQGNSPSSGSGGGQGFDQHLDPGATTGQDPATAQQQRNAQEWKTAVAGAANAARAQGKLPAAMERMLNETLEPKVSWQEHIIGFFNRRPGGGTYNWTKPDRRLITRAIIAPGRSGFGCGPIVIGVDTSGSITDAILTRFLGEVAGILDDVRPSALYIMWCDAKLHRTDECTDTGDLLEARKAGAPGGGGTSFIPVFDGIRDQGIEPDALLYLTDGLGTFPDTAPGYAVLWGNISPPDRIKYPFGTVVDVPLK